MSRTFFAVESGTMTDADLNQALLESGLAPLPLGWIRYFPSSTSTNDVAAKLAGESAPDFSLVVADQQTAGKGRAGRKWFSAPKAALTFSLALKAPYEVANQLETNDILLRYTALGALAVCDALETHYRLTPAIKWPNDVLLNERKVCGVLAEAHWLGDQLEAIIIGIGINIHPRAMPPDSELLFPATYLEKHVSEQISRLEVLQQVLSRLLFWRSQIESPAFIQAWQARLAFRQKWVKVLDETNPSSQPIVGRISGLDSAGRLLLQDQHGAMLTIHFGELRLRPV